MLGLHNQWRILDFRLEHHRRLIAQSQFAGFSLKADYAISFLAHGAHSILVWGVNRKGLLPDRLVSGMSHCDIEQKTG